MSPKSYKSLALTAIAGLTLATLAGCGNGQDQETFLAQQQSEATGYRLEYFERDGLLFVHRPNGEKDGIDLAGLRRVFLHRIPATDSNDGKAKYWWQFEGPARTVSAPFFSGEPAAMATMLRGELADFDEATALKMADTFGKNHGSYCLVWASAEYLKETHTEAEAECRP